MNRLPAPPAAPASPRSLLGPAATLATAAARAATRMDCPSPASFSSSGAAGWEDEVERAWGAAPENDMDSAAARGVGLLAGLAIGGELLAALSPARIWRSQRWFSQVRRLWP